MPKLPRQFRPIHPVLVARPELATIAANAKLDRAAPVPEPTEAEHLLHNMTGIRVQDAPWLPQPGEDAQSYAAFQLWLESDVEPPRNELAKRWAWADRKIAFESQVGKVGLASPEARRDLTLRAVQVVKQIVQLELSKLLLAAAQGQHPTMTVREAMRAIKDAGLLERLLDGQSTENVSVKVSEGGKLESLTDEEFQAVLAQVHAR